MVPLTSCGFHKPSQPIVHQGLKDLDERILVVTEYLGQLEGRIVELESRTWWSMLKHWLKEVIHDLSRASD